jgi:hypothetical protein
MIKKSSKRGNTLLIPPIAIRNQDKSTREKRFPKEGANFSQILLAMGELC